MNTDYFYAMDFKKYITTVPDFPKPGIAFKDIAPLLASSDARGEVVSTLAKAYKNKNIDLVVGIESRGFLLGVSIADALECGFAMMRKPGKLPGDIISEAYSLEYGTDTLELQANAITEGMRVLIHDDVLATGGTAAAACKLVEKAGGVVVGLLFLIELDFLNGSEKLNNQEIYSLIHY